jgi:transmembrane sensor
MEQHGGFGNTSDTQTLGAPVMTLREQIENEAALWVARRADPDVRAAEEETFTAWLDASPTHKLAYWRLERVWEEADRLKALRDPPAPAPARRRLLLEKWKPLALAAGLAAGIGLAVIMTDPEIRAAFIGGETRIETNSGGRQLVSLADGSAVELNTATRLRAYVTRGERKVWLDQGEAYFEVAHDPEHPFIVYAGPRTITVLGTRFSVRRDGERVTVAVRDGRVEVAVPGSSVTAQSRLLTRGDMVVADGSSTFVAPTSLDKVEQALSWRVGLINFDQTTLADAAKEFNRYNTKPIVVAPDVADLRISGAFEARNTAAFGRLMRDGLGLKVSDDGERVMISEQSRE